MSSAKCRPFCLDLNVLNESEKNLKKLKMTEIHNKYMQQK